MSHFLNSPVFTGTPQAPTPLTADSSTSLATTAFVKAQGYGTGTGTVTAIGVTTANGVSGSSSGGATPSLTISLGAITPSTVNGLTLAAAANGFTIAGGTASKTFTCSNTLTLTGTDGSTLAIGTGGTLGTAAYTAASAYATVAQVHYVGTTSIAANRASASQTLTGVNIDGNAATVTTNANLTGDVTSTGNATTLAAATVTGKALTGFVLGADASALTASDTILSAFQHIQVQVNAKQAGDADLTAIAALAGTSGFLKKTAADTWTLDTATYGSGTVTSIAVTTANGVSGSSSGGATPSLTISLGAITPTTVNGLTFTAATNGFTVAGGTTSKTLTVLKTMSFTSADDTSVITVPAGTKTLLAIDGSAASLTNFPTFNQNTTGTAASFTGNLTGDVTSTGMATTLSSATINGKLLTGFVLGTDATALAATDTHLQAYQKLQVQVNAKQAGLGFTAENVANKSTSTSLGISDTLYPTQNAVKTYVDNSVVGLLDDRGNYNASVNTFPAAGGSGTAGAIMKGDIWYISVQGTLGSKLAQVGSSVRALADTPGQTEGNWDILNVGLGYTPAAQNQTFYLGTTQIAINRASATIALTGITSIDGSSASFTGNLTGDVTSTGMATSISAATVNGKALTGYSLGTNSASVAATDTILQGFQKLQYQYNIDIVKSVTTKSAAYNPVLATDNVLLCDASGGAFACTLAAAPITGEQHTFKKIDSSVNAITISGNGKNIDGAANVTLPAQWNALTLIYNGTAWYII